MQPKIFFFRVTQTTLIYVGVGKQTDSSDNHTDSDKEKWCGVNEHQFSQSKTEPKERI